MHPRHKDAPKDLVQTAGARNNHGYVVPSLDLVFVRLGDGTEESHARVQAALESLWPYTVELFAADELDRDMAEAGIAPRLSDVQAAWSARIDAILSEATLKRPIDRPHAWHGKRGQHSEHLGYLLAEMQSIARAHPGATW